MTLLRDVAGDCKIWATDGSGNNYRQLKSRELLSQCLQSVYKTAGGVNLEVPVMVTVLPLTRIVKGQEEHAT